MTLSVSPRSATRKERQHDLYETPPVAVRALAAVEKLPGVIWEPACGRGAISEELIRLGHTVVSTDLNDNYKHGLPGVDFLTARRPAGRIGGIITNPPYGLAEKFVDRALTHVPYVAMLLRLAFLEGIRRMEWLQKTGLSQVLVSSRRLPMMHRDGWKGPKSTSTQAFAWFIWDLREGDPWYPEIHWFDWKDYE